MVKRNETMAIASASLAVLSWSTVATAFKLALQHLTYFELLLIASTTSWLIFSIMMSFHGHWRVLKTLSLRRWGYFALLGLLNPVAYYLILFNSYSLLPAQIAQPINYLWPVVLTVMLALFAHCPISRLKYVGLLISLCGVTLISVGAEGVGHLHVSVVGLIMALLSAVFWASYWMMTNRDKETTDGTVSLFLCFLFGTLYLFLMSCFVGVRTFTTTDILSGMYVGCFEMGIPFIAFSYAIRKTENPTLINQMCYLAPFLSLFFISTILDEPIAVTTYVGLALIIAGILFNQYVAKRQNVSL